MRVLPLSSCLAALALLGPLACEPPQPPVEPKPAPIASTPKDPAVVAGPAYDLSPVAEPADLVGLMRWKTPSATVSTMTGCANLPTELGGIATAGFLNGLFKDVLRDDVDADKLAAVIATDASVDLVVALEPGARRGEPIFAFSMGLKSIDGAKAAIKTDGGSPAEVVPGVWRVGSGKERRDLSCVVAVATGPTPARIVCGQRDNKWVTALVPYMTRTLPTVAPAATDLHGEVRYAPIDARYGDFLRGKAQTLPLIAQSQASIGDKAFDSALTDAATALSDEATALTRDLDRVTIDLNSDPAICLSTTMALQLRDKSSWFAGTLFDRPDRAGPPPAIFWRAPKDSDSVSFGRAGDPARFAGIVRTLRTMIDGALGKFQIGSSDDRKALADLISTPLNKDTNSVQASGHLTPPAAKADAKAKPPAKPAPDVKQTGQQKVDEVLNGIGWTVMGFDQGPEALSKMLKDVVATYGRKGLMDPVRKGMGTDARYLPTIRVVGAPASLGKDSFDVEVKGDFLSEVPPPPVVFKGGKGAKPPPPPPKPATPTIKPERITFAFHIILMADGKNTWIAFGANKDELVRRLLMVKTGAPDSDTIAARPGLESLRSGKNMSGGFFTMSLFSKALSLGDRSMQGLGNSMGALKDAPHKGETPIFFTSTMTTGNTPRAEVTIKLSKDSVEDLVAIILKKRVGGAERQMPSSPPTQP